jgi:hypothetical protein
MFKNKTTYALSVLALLFLFSGSAFAAAPVPMDAVKWIGDQLNLMVDGHIGIFLGEGQTLLSGTFAFLLVYYLLVGLLSRQIRNELLVELVFNFMLCQMMLTFYDSPMPWGGGISFHQIFAAEATWAANTIDISTVNDVIAATLAMWKGMSVHPWDFLGGIIFTIAIVLLSIIWLLCSGITLIAHIALGFGSLIGPLVIWTFVWPVMSWLFWGWIRFMVTYALYIVSSSAVVFIYAHVILFFFNNVIKGDYTMANLSAIIVPFIFLNAVFVIAFWQCHSWARDLASGTASAGANVSAAVQAAAIAFLA